MDFQTIHQQLDDLPATFRRPGQPYIWLVDALASCLYLLCHASDSLQAQYNFNTANNSWLDVWGDLVGILRNVTESDQVYQNRIQQTILAWRDSPLAIARFLQIVYNLVVAVLEQSPVGYKILFPFVSDINTITQAILELKYVRPAGVPFQVYSEIGTYLNTVDYYGIIGSGGVAGADFIGRATGSYLANSQPLVLNIPASTNNAVGIIPSLIFQDPTLNP